MTPEIRRAALRIAAKTALVVTIGCSGSSSSTKATPSNAAPAGAPIACDAHLSGLATVEKGELAANDPVRERPDVYGKVFADVEARGSARTKECCTEELVTSGSSAKHRWECCTALDGVPAGATPSACTPWGPPCPPEMPLA
jgi:hypothetical protein